MPAYFDLRERLAELYPTDKDWTRIARESGADLADIVLQGSARGVWSNILVALRGQNCLEGLMTALKHANELDAADLATQYAAEAAAGNGKVVEIQGLQRVEIDLNGSPREFIDSLNSLNSLSMPLLRMSLATGQPSLEDFDHTLSGRNTIEAKSNLVQYRRQAAEVLSVLEQRKAHVKSALTKILEEISSIERARMPSKPEPYQWDRFGGTPTEHERESRYEQYRKELARYEEARARYTAMQDSSPALRARVAPLEKELAELQTSIASQRAQNLAGEPPLLEGIMKARDLDMLRMLDRVLHELDAKLRSGTDPLGGFCLLLGAGCVLDFFTGIMSQPSAVSHARSNFSAVTSGLTEALENNLPGLGKGFLAGPALIERVLRDNKSTLEALQVRLRKLPEQRFNERVKRTKALLAEDMPSPVDFSKLEKESEIEHAKADLVASRGVLVDHLSRVQALVDDEPADLAATARQALSDIASTIRQIENSAAGKDKLLRAIDDLKVLLQKGGSMIQIPPFARLLCEGLPEDFRRRFNYSVDDVVRQARTTEFVLKSAREIVESRCVNAYARSGTDARGWLTKCEKKLCDFDRALTEIDRRYEVVAEAYQDKLSMMACLSVAPGINLIAFLNVVGILNRMAPLFESKNTAYVKLGRRTSKMLGRAVFGALAGTAAAALVAIMHFNDSLYDMSWGTLVGALTLTSSLSCFFALRNFLVAKAKVLKGKHEELC